MVLEIEVQGARQVREAVPDAVQVFIAPPSMDALRDAPGGAWHRLADRRCDARLATAAQAEMQAQDEFAHVVVNDRLERARRGAGGDRAGIAGRGSSIATLLSDRKGCP